MEWGVCPSVMKVQHLVGFTLKLVIKEGGRFAARVRKKPPKKGYIGTKFSRRLILRTLVGRRASGIPSVREVV